MLVIFLSLLVAVFVATLLYFIFGAEPIRLRMKFHCHGCDHFEMTEPLTVEEIKEWNKRLKKEHARCQPEDA